jgi:IrrE N-terminal-like domain
MLEWSREEMTCAVDALVAELLERAGLVQPPVDAIHLAQRCLGIEVCLDRRQANRGRAQRSPAGRHIYLRPEPSEERHQWTVAHEIGEHLRPALLQRLGSSAEEARDMAGESLANLLAHRLLVPTCWFAEDAPSLEFEVLKLKERYRTASHEVIAFRLLDLPDPCVVTVLDNNHVSRRKSNAWPITRQLLPVEQECQEYVNYYSRKRSAQRDGWSVTCWPVHKLDWKREILRSVYEE